MIADLFIRLSATFLSPEDSELFVVWRFLNSTQVGDFRILSYGHKTEKNRNKVQKYPEARRKYGTEPMRMDIKHRKSRKKSKIIRKLEGNTEPGRRKWT